jgi:hypothetical protein
MTKNEITIFTNDSKLKEFEDWFKVYRKQNFPESNELNKGKSLFIMENLTINESNPTNNVHSIVAIFNNPPSWRQSYPSTKIKINLAAFTDFKLDVTIKLNSRNELNVFITFLNKLGEFWPESEEIINKYIFSLVSNIESEGEVESTIINSKHESRPISINIDNNLKYSKQGQSRYSDDVKLKALKEWDNLKPGNLTLTEFLNSRFVNDNGIPGLPEQTFHGWRRTLREKGSYKN